MITSFMKTLKFYFKEISEISSLCHLIIKSYVHRPLELKGGFQIISPNTNILQMIKLKNRIVIFSGKSEIVIKFPKESRNFWNLT